MFPRITNWSEVCSFGAASFQQSATQYAQVALCPTPATIARNKGSSYPGCPYGALRTAALPALLKKGVDPSSFNSVIYLMPKSFKCWVRIMPNSCTCASA